MMLEHLRAGAEIRIDIATILADHPHHVTLVTAQ
jgi:hypothetical protein